ncbi:hypothetical protein DYB31_011322, partial [Aphanomyces astaci]
MRRLLEQHWSDFTHKYPSILGPAPTALAKPVHGSATATATTRSSALALPAFRDGASQREGYGQAAAVPWGAQGQDPMADLCGYCLSSGIRSTYTCTKLSQAFHQNAVRQDFVFLPVLAAIPPGELPPSDGRGGGTGTSFLNTIRQGYASSDPPGYAPSGRRGYTGSHSCYASFYYGDYRDDQRDRSPFRQSASRYRSRSGDRYRNSCGHFREDRGYFCDDSGANQDDRRYRSRSQSMYAVQRHRSRSRSAQSANQGYAQPASNLQRSQSRSPSRGSTPTYDGKFTTTYDEDTGFELEEIQALQMDNAKEYVKLGARIQSEYDTRLRYTNANTPTQNRVAERRMVIIV